MAQELIQIPASVVGMGPRQDRSWLIKFETRELSGEDVKVLADNFQGEGWLVFKPNGGEVLKEEIPQSSADAGVKSQAQRLRSAIMVLWKHTGSRGDPEAFYRTTTEKLIEFTLSKIPEEES